jgi:hypothetical protein
MAKKPKTDSAKAKPDKTKAQSDKDRRRYPRFHGSTLLANIGGKLVKVTGVSAGGMELEKGFKLTDGPMRFTLYPTKGGRVDLNKGTGGSCVLVRETADYVAMRFEPASYPLLKFVAEWSGVIPDKTAQQTG